MLLRAGTGTTSRSTRRARSAAASSAACAARHRRHRRLPALPEGPARPKLQALFKELLINVTSFFRDGEAFEMLKRDILPKLLADKPADYVFRIWVAGCATGEEAYSVAILLREYMDDTRPRIQGPALRTDLDDDAIAIARAGLYPPNIAQDVSPERLRRFFTKEDAGYRVKKEIREMVVFAVQNVIKDPPFTRLDLLCCRNLMIYLEPELQNRLIPDSTTRSAGGACCSCRRRKASATMPSCSRRSTASGSSTGHAVGGIDAHRDDRRTPGPRRPAAVRRRPRRARHASERQHRRPDPARAAAVVRAGVGRDRH
jgi:chemotaxis methyl-accepting protein methylase